MQSDGEFVTYDEAKAWVEREVKAAEQRVMDALEGRPDPGINEREAYARAEGYAAGQRDALAGAVQRVAEELHALANEEPPPEARDLSPAGVIRLISPIVQRTIKGDSDE